MKDAPNKERIEAMKRVIEKLGPLVEAGTSTRSPVGFAFLQATSADREDYSPSLGRLSAAVAEFEHLPEEQRRSICNGWSADDITDPPRRDELVRESGDAIALFLNIDSSGSAMTWQISDAVQPVEVRIAFGTSKAQALHHLRKIEKAILEHYHTLIASECESLGKLETTLCGRLMSEAAAA